MPDSDAETVPIPLTRLIGAGELLLSGRPRGMVVIAGSGGATSDAERWCALGRAFWDAGLAVVRLDVPHPASGEDAFDADAGGDTLAGRIVAITDWWSRDPGMRELSIGYFALGAAVVPSLRAAAARPEYVRVIVAIGGNPAAAASVLAAIAAPTLLIIDGALPETLEPLRTVQHLFQVTSALEQIDGAVTGADSLSINEEAFARSRDWLLAYLTPPRFHAQRPW